MQNTDTTSTEIAATEQNIAWQSMDNAEAVEAWLIDKNRDLQQLLGRRVTAGQGLCLTLTLGGECFLHTNSDGDVLLDVSAEAAWAAPVIAAATQSALPKGSVWLLPSNTLAQLILGLNSLIASSRLVISHSYRIR